MLFQELCSLTGVTRDRLHRLGTIGKASGIAEVEIVSFRDKFKQSFKDGEAAESGVEDADGGSHSYCTRSDALTESAMEELAPQHCPAGMGAPCGQVFG